jgi:hypothetical protein
MVCLLGIGLIRQLAYGNATSRLIYTPPSTKLKNSPRWYEEEVGYFCRLFPGPVVHREFLVADVKSRYGTMLLDELWKPDTLARFLRMSFLATRTAMNRNS